MLLTGNDDPQKTNAKTSTRGQADGLTVRDFVRQNLEPGGNIRSKELVGGRVGNVGVDGICNGLSNCASFLQWALPTDNGSTLLLVLWFFQTSSTAEMLCAKKKKHETSVDPGTAAAQEWRWQATTHTTSLAVFSSLVVK